MKIDNNGKQREIDNYGKMANRQLWKKKKENRQKCKKEGKLTIMQTKRKLK